MKQATKIIVSAIALTGILALGLISGSGCGSKPTPATTVYYQMGQTAETSREVLTITSADRTSQYRKGSFAARLFGAFVDAPPGTVFIIVEVSVTNVGKGSSLGVSPKDFSLKDSEDRVWPSVDYSGANPYPSKKLTTGQTVYGYIAFNPLATATGLEVSCVVQGSPPVLGVWQLPY